MRDHQAVFPVATMCRVLRVSPSVYYAWRDRPLSRRAAEDVVILEHLRTFHERSDATYGAPRLLGDLREIGVHVGQKRVARVLRRGDPIPLFRTAH